MRKLANIFIMALVLIMMCGTASASGIDPEKDSTNLLEYYGPSEVSKKEPEPDVYWYSIRMRIDNKRKDIEITGNGAKITMGTKKGFNKAVWKGIAHRQVVIGPFQSEAEALNSKIYYKKSKDKINELPQATAPSQMYWFEVSFKELRRMNSYEYTHSPAAVSSGSSTEFTDALYEGLSFLRLSIGPFWDYEQAEQAKAIYRLNE